MTEPGVRSASSGADFTKLWFASSLSAVGDGVTQIAGALLIVTLTRDPVLVSGLLVAQTVPWLLFTLPGGVIVDRFDRRRLMIGASVTRALALGLLGISVVSGHVNLPLLYCVFFAIGCAGLLFENASTTAIPSLVATAELERANGRIQASKVVGEQLLARPVGGFLFSLASWSPFLIDALALAVISILAALLPKNLNRDAVEPARLDLRRAILEGMRWLVHDRIVRTLTLTVGLSNIGLGAVFSMLVLVANERLGVGPVGYGFLLAAAAVGGVLGGLGSGRIVAALGPGTTIRAGLLIELASYIGLIYATRIALVIPILVVFSLHLAVFAAIGASLRQALTPPALLGRVHSAYRLISTAGMLAGAALGGVLGKYYGLTAPFWMGLICALIFTAAVWRTFDNRTIQAARACVAEGTGETRR